MVTGRTALRSARSSSRMDSYPAFETVPDGSCTPKSSGTTSNPRSSAASTSPPMHVCAPLTYNREGRSRLWRGSAAMQPPPRAHGAVHLVGDEAGAG